MSQSAERRKAERLAREKLLLQSAQDILLSEGYLGLTMDKLATATGYAKGTLYLHFKNKEDLICGLLAEFQNRRMELFDRVAGLNLHPRAQMMAFGLAAELFTRAYPENARIEPMLKIASLRNKASNERREALEAVEMRCFSNVLAATQAGIASGDLILPNGEAPESLVFGLWAMHVGAHLLMSVEEVNCPAQTAQTAPLSLFPIAQHLLDGYAWKPLSTEFDYASLRETIFQEHFPEEATRIARLSSEAPRNID